MEKRCNSCGTVSDEQVLYCPNCGAESFTPIESAEMRESVVADVTEEPVNANVIAGIVGAFLFSIIGAAIYFLVYQMGFVAGICGLIMFVLANFGYGLFSGTKNKVTTAGIVISIIMTLVMLFAAEYFCVSYEIYLAFKDTGVTIFDAVRATPDFLVEPEVRDAVIGDLGFSYLFGAIACAGNIINMVKSKKK